jgi:CheY-like chemotaxis protein
MSELQQSHADREGKALVVDDDPMVRRFISAVLRTSGFEVLEAADATEAMVVFQAGESSLDLVITDVEMPEMNGCELARMLLATHPHLPILLVSGAHSEPPEPFPFLQKPFTPDRLRDTLQKMLGARESRIA